ncbi:MAG: S-layer homology domain-containing protein, partial [Oscillospiraceae bacterium]|nr:S-layer homology domain-containing protein [Oscillospiraceae bacterium]
FEVGDGPEYPILIYITVTFDAGAHGTFAGAQQQTTERVRRGTVLDATTVPTANANAGYAFTGWTPSNPVGHTVLAAITFTAQFDAREIGINVDNDGDITVTVPEGDSYNVDSNGTIVITLPDADPEDNITVTLPNNNWNYEISEDDDGNIIVIITRPATPGPGPGGPVGGGGGITVLPDTQVPLDPAPERFFAPYHNAFLVGSPDGTVRPQANITRAEVATILFRLLNDEFRASVWSQSNNFTDVSSDAWFNNAISTMSNAGIITGNNGAFRPNDAVTRAEFAAMIARFFTEFEAEDVSYFVDIEGNWAEDYINLIAQFGWIQGAGDGTFNPNAQMTRAEAAAIVNRMLERVIDGQDGLLYGRTRFPDVTNANAWYYLYLQEATHSTLFERQENGRVVWTTILPHLDWTVLERPHSTPRAIEAARQVQMEAADDVA